MSALEQLTPTQLQLMVVAWDLADHVPGFSAWDVNHAAGERYGYRGHQTILRTILRLLKRLVDKGYLTSDSDAGGRGGLYRIAVDREAGAEPFIDKLLELLGDDPHRLQVLENRLHDRLLDATEPAAHAV